MEAVYEKTVGGNVEEVGQRLERAVHEHKYGVLGWIDLREKMRSKGVEFGPACRIYEVCSPVRAKRVLEQDMSISTALPCRIAVYETAGAVKVATLKPRTILASFDRPELDEEAGQVENDLKAIIDDVASVPTKTGTGK